MRVSNDGAIVISAAIETQDAVNLAAAGSISQISAGRVGASSLTARSTGGLDLQGINEFSVLTLINDGGDVTVNNMGDLKVAGIVQLTGGDVVVTSGGSIEISDAVVTEGAVALTGTGSIAQIGAGRIAAASLSTQSSGGLRLGGANEIGVLRRDQRWRRM